METAQGPLTAPALRYIETETVRYVYQPVEQLYVLLVTNKSSNILEDLEALRLISKCIQDVCQVSLRARKIWQSPPPASRFSEKKDRTGTSIADRLFRASASLTLGVNSFTRKPLSVYLRCDLHICNFFHDFAFEIF